MCWSSCTTWVKSFNDTQPDFGSASTSLDFHSSLLGSGQVVGVAAGAAAPVAPAAAMPPLPLPACAFEAESWPEMPAALAPERPAEEGSFGLAAAPDLPLGGWEVAVRVGVPASRAGAAMMPALPVALTTLLPAALVVSAAAVASVCAPAQALKVGSQSKRRISEAREV